MEKAEPGFLPTGQTRKLRLKDVEAGTCSKVPWEVEWGQGCKPWHPPPPSMTRVLSASLRRIKYEFVIDGRNTWEPVRMWISLLS